MWQFEEILSETFNRCLEEYSDEDGKAELAFHDREQRLIGIIQFIYNLGWSGGYECHRENHPEAEDLEEVKEKANGHQTEETRSWHGTAAD